MYGGGDTAVRVVHGCSCVLVARVPT
eukprot:COSAG06_NODE_63343_length_262_cov_1.196319_1_plen_25_part_10